MFHLSPLVQLALLWLLTLLAVAVFALVRRYAIRQTPLNRLWRVLLTLFLFVECVCGVLLIAEFTAPLEKHSVRYLEAVFLFLILSMYNGMVPHHLYKNAFPGFSTLASFLLFFLQLVSSVATTATLLYFSGPVPVAVAVLIGCFCAGATMTGIFWVIFTALPPLSFTLSPTEAMATRERGLFWQVIRGRWSLLQGIALCVASWAFVQMRYLPGTSFFKFAPLVVIVLSSLLQPSLIAGEGKRLDEWKKLRPDEADTPSNP
jgi:hypothetical protein